MWAEKSLFIISSERFSICSSRSLIVSNVQVHHSLLTNIGMWCVKRILFLSFLYMDVQLFQLLLLKRLPRLSFPPLNYLGTFAENKYITYMWVSLGALTSIPSICISICVLLPHWLDDFSFLLTFEIMWSMSSIPFQNFLAVQGPLHFHLESVYHLLQKSLVGWESNCTESIDTSVENILTRLSSNP